MIFSFQLALAVIFAAGIHNLGNSTPTVNIKADGSAKFAGNIVTHSYSVNGGLGFSINESGTGDDARAIINIKGKATTDANNIALAVRRGEGDGNNTQNNLWRYSII